MLQRHIYGANVWESLSSSAKRFLITNESTALRNRTDTYGAFGALHWIGVAYTERVGWMSSMKRRVGWRDVYSEQSWEIPLVLLGLLMIRSRFFDWTDELSLRRWNWWGVHIYLHIRDGWQGALISGSWSDMDAFVAFQAAVLGYLGLFGCQGQ